MKPKILYILLFISFFVIIALKIYNNKEFFLSYKRCDKKKIKGIIKDIFDKNEITKDNTNWDIFIPCGYTNLEKELKTLKLFNKKQKIFGISGCDKIVSKNNLWKLLKNEYTWDKASTIMPGTYVFSDDDDMQRFSKKFSKNNIYILKKNLQRKKGLRISNNYYNILNSKYDKFKLIQEFKESYLINNRKFNLRYYLLIISKNDKISIYLHKYNKILYAKENVSKDKLNFDSNVTNSYLMDDNLYKNNPFNSEELFKFMKTKESDKNIEKIEKNIKNIFVLFSRAITLYLNTQEHVKKNESFQLFGVDVIIDNKLAPYILEVNKGPDLKAKNDRDKKLKTKVLNDIFSKLELIHQDDYNLFEEIYSI